MTNPKEVEGTGVQARIIESRAPQVDVTVLDRLWELVGDEFGSLLEDFREDAPQWLFQMRVAIEAGTPIALRYAAHSLKSAAGHFGAHSLRAVAAQLEAIGREEATEGAKPLLEQATALCSDVLFELEVHSLRPGPGA